MALYPLFALWAGITNKSHAVRVSDPFEAPDAKAAFIVLTRMYQEQHPEQNIDSFYCLFVAPCDETGKTIHFDRTKDWHGWTWGGKESYPLRKK